MKSEILLVLDIDETLIYADSEGLDYPHDFEVAFYKIYKRPGLDDFLSKVSAFYQVGFWSSASNHYVKKVVEVLVKDILKPEFVWGRSRCTFEIDENRTQNRAIKESHFNYVKRLSKLAKKLQHPIEKILIIDDSPHKSKYNKSNAILIKS